MIGLLLSFSLGWLRSALFLMATWMWVPIAYTGRPFVHLGTVCQSVWSGDLGKGAYLLIYVYFFMVCLWWLAPHSTSANVGLLSIGALPCLSSPLYKRLKAFVAKILNTTKYSFIKLKSVFTPERRTSKKSKHFDNSHRNRTSGSVYNYIEEIPCGDRYQRKAISLTSKDNFYCDSKCANVLLSDSIVREPETSAELDSVGEGCRGILNEIFQFFLWVLYAVLRVSEWTPKLEAHGKDASCMYYGMEERHVTVLRRNNTKVGIVP